jgi:hypothetical protein
MSRNERVGCCIFFAAVLLVSYLLDGRGVSIWSFFIRCFNSLILAIFAMCLLMTACLVFGYYIFALIKWVITLCATIKSTLATYFFIIAPLFLVLTSIIGWSFMFIGNVIPHEYVVADSILFIHGRVIPREISLAILFFTYLIVFPVVIEALNAELIEQSFKMDAKNPTRHALSACLSMGITTLVAWGVLFAFFSSAWSKASPHSFIVPDASGIFQWLKFSFNEFISPATLGILDACGLQITNIRPNSFSGNLILIIFRFFAVTTVINSIMASVRIYQGDRTYKLNWLQEQFRNALNKQ